MNFSLRKKPQPYHSSEASQLTLTVASSPPRSAQPVNEQRRRGCDCFSWYKRETQMQWENLERLETSLGFSPFPDHADGFNYNANQMVDKQIRQCLWNSPHESQIYFRTAVKILAKQDGVWNINKMLPTTQFATSTVHPSRWPWQTPSIFLQVKHFRALQEQARTYLDLLCSMCDLSDSSVKSTAKDIQQTEQLVTTKGLHDHSKLSVWLCSLLQIFFEGCQV